MITRRGFIAAVVIAPFVPRPPLQFHPHVIALTMPPLNVEWYRKQVLDSIGSNLQRIGDLRGVLEPDVNGTLAV